MYKHMMGFPGGASGKEPTCQGRSHETRVQSLEKEMATHSSILSWRIPWTEEPGGLQFMGSQRVDGWLLLGALTSLLVFSGGFPECPQPEHQPNLVIPSFLFWGSSKHAQQQCWSLSCIQLFVTPCTIAHQAPLSMGFSRKEQWGGLPFPSPEDLPYPGIKPGSPALQTNYLLSELQGSCKQAILNMNSWTIFFIFGKALSIPDLRITTLEDWIHCWR